MRKKRSSHSLLLSNLPSNELTLTWFTGGYDVFQGSLDPAILSGAQWPVNEPLAVVSAMAAATESIGFGVTVSTTYEQPYHLARRLSTADHLSGGRYVSIHVPDLFMTGADHLY